MTDKFANCQYYDTVAIAIAAGQTYAEYSRYNL